MSTAEHLIEEDENQIAEKQPSILNSLTRRQKVAAILVAMGKEHASSILRYFSNEDLALLNGVAQTLPVIDAADLESLVEEFESNFADGGVLSEAGIQFSTLLKETLGEESANDILCTSEDDIIVDNVWNALTQLTPEKLYFYIADEHPQIFAYIFSRLPSDLASKLILFLPANERTNIIKRTLVLSDISKSSINLIEEIMRKKLSRRINNGQSANYKQVAGIFNNLEKGQITQVLNDLKDLDENDLINIKNRLFVFEDLPRLSKEARLLVFDGIDANTIIVAIADTDVSFQKLVLESLSHRTRRLIEAELNAGNENIAPENVTIARRRIAQKVIDLSDKGSISIEQI